MGARRVRPVVVVGEIAYVHLKCGAIAIIDAEDAPVVSLRNWTLRNDKSGMCVRGTPGALARYLLKPPTNKVVDHIDGNPLNNRRSNLRICSQGQNALNRVGWKKSELPCGVSKTTESSSFTARIKLGNKLVHLGTFKTPEEAHEAYKARAKQEYGEFCRWSI